MNDNVKRNNSIDLLRIIACLFVVIIHVSAIWINGTYNNYNNLKVFYFINTSSKFAVPIFFMISGLFNINNSDNEKISLYYNKIFKKIIIPCILFSIFYALIKIIECFINHFNIILVIKEIFSGNLGALWFLYTIIPIYLITPFILIIKKNVSNKTFSAFCWIYFIYSIISALFSKFSINWSLGNAANYLGFYLIGYELGKKKLEKNFLKKTLIIIGIILLSFVNSYLVYINNVNKITSFDFSNNFSPINVVYSILIFILFLMINSSLKLYNISKNTFAIYLIHPFIISVIVRIINHDILYINPFLCFLLILIVVIISSYLFSIIYNYLYNKVINK